MTLLNYDIQYFQEDDILNMVPKVDVLSRGSLESMLQLACSGLTYTVFVEGKPIALIGGHIVWPGCAQMWAVMSQQIGRGGLFLTKISNLILERQAVFHNIHRYQCIIDARSVINIRWIQALNFKYEATMYKASPIETDLYVYVRREDKNVRRVYRSTRLRNHLDKLLRMAG